ncbi:MAG: hypothetical protein ACRC8Y_05150 [Chroococcales cyanobacterium]
MINFRELGREVAKQIAFGEPFVPIDFKAAKKKKSCNKGYACKGTCISTKFNCRNPLDGQAKNYADWLKTNKDKLTKSQKSAAIKQGMNPKGESVQAALQSKVKDLRSQLKASKNTTGGKKQSTPKRPTEKEFKDSFRKYYFEDRKRQAMAGTYVMREKEVLKGFQKKSKLDPSVVQEMYEKLTDEGLISRVRGREDYNLQWIDD